MSVIALELLFLARFLIEGEGVTSIISPAE